MNLFTLTSSLFIPRKSRQCETFPGPKNAPGLDSGKIVGRKRALVIIGHRALSWNPSSKFRQKFTPNSARDIVRQQSFCDVDAWWSQTYRGNPIEVAVAPGNIQGNMTAMQSQVIYSNFARTNFRNLHCVYVTPQLKKKITTVMS